MIGSNLVQSVVRRFNNLLDTASAANGAAMVGFLYATAYAGNTVGAWLKGLAGSTGATFIGFIQSIVGAVSRTIAFKLAERVSVMDFGALGNNVADDYVAILAAVTWAKLTGGTVYFPKPSVAYKMGTTLVLGDGVTLIGDCPAMRWRNVNTPVRINYTGGGAAVTVAPATTVLVDGVQMRGLHFDGTSAAAGAHGLYLNCSAASSSIEGCYFEDCAFTNFPGNQICHVGNVFDVVYKRVAGLNPARASLDIVNVSALLPSQLTFDDCWLSPYTTGTWGFIGNGVDVRFIGGTVAPYDNSVTGANGISQYGGLSIQGTHVENRNSLATGNIGIRYYNSNGAHIAPSACLTFGTGVQIGLANGDANVASGWVIAGSVSGNNTGAGGHDVVITNGGVRTGVILGGGASIVVLDNRQGVDGVAEVSRMNRGASIDYVKLLAVNGTAVAPSQSFINAPTVGNYTDGTNMLTAVGGVQVSIQQPASLALGTKLYPTKDDSHGVQTSAGLYANAGVPAVGIGANGDFYFRSDGVAGTRIYHKEAGAWVATAA